jgi:protoporphyrin/coproporphyrin ferrochelatase
MPRRAIVLMNLGGPDSPAAVEPFLYNLFSDPAIIALPRVLRLPLARLIARRRFKAARDIYARLGGASPLLANTEAQARALEAALDDGSCCFIAMRYWHPTSQEAAAEVAAWRPEEIVCLPLYPQYSTTTTASSLAAWKAAAAGRGLSVPTHAIHNYPTEPGFVTSLARLIGETIGEGRSRLLLTAHGLPQRVVRAGDPYCREVEATAAAVVTALARPGLDWTLCYQSRVGPLAWVGPETPDEIRRAGRDGVSLVVAPISFVSEHSETLIELDMDYRRLAAECGVPDYRRVPTVGTEPEFIAGLAELVRGA